jgi:hypothetical protein
MVRRSGSLRGHRGSPDRITFNAKIDHIDEDFNKNGSVISLLSVGLELLQPDGLKRFQIISIVVSRIIDRLELVEDLNDEALLSLSFQSFVREALGGKAPMFS